MSEKTQPHYSYFRFKEASIRYKRIYELKTGGKKPGLFNLLLNGIIVPAFFKKFAIEYFDDLLAGSDPLLTLLAAYNLAKKGKRILIYRSFPWDAPRSVLAVFEARVSIWNADVIDEIKKHIDFDGESFSSCIEYLSNKVSSLKDENNKPLVVIIYNSSISSDNKSSSEINKNQIFWEGKEVDFFKENQKSIHWAIIRKNISHLDLERKKSEKTMFFFDRIRSFCLIVVNNVVLTSRTDPYFCREFVMNEVKIGDSLVSTEKHGVFQVEDRIKDIKDTMKI